jgi:AcrR family transcriptional regulator
MPSQHPRGRAGRPRGDSGARQQLIDAARTLFTTLPFKKVSTRMVAESAGVNAALIHYYFGDKAGLFEHMLRETLAPVATFFQRSPGEPHQSLEDFMRSFAQTMAPNPDVPKLAMRIMSEQDDDQRPIIEKVMGEVATNLSDQLFNNPVTLAQMRPGVSPHMARLTIFSLLLFPFIAPAAALKIHGIELNAEKVLQLVEHNIDVLKNGLLKKDDATDEATE